MEIHDYLRQCLVSHRSVDRAILDTGICILCRAGRSEQAFELARNMVPNRLLLLDALQAYPASCTIFTVDYIATLVLALKLGDPRSFVHSS